MPLALPRATLSLHVARDGDVVERLQAAAAVADAMQVSLKGALAHIRAIAAAERDGAGEPMGRDAGFRSRMDAVEVQILALEFTELRILGALSAGQNVGPESSLLKTRGTELHQARAAAQGLEAEREHALDAMATQLDAARQAATEPAARAERQGEALRKTREQLTELAYLYTRGKELDKYPRIRKYLAIVIILLFVRTCFNPGIAQDGEKLLLPTPTGWTRTFGGDNNDYGYSVQQTIDGGYIMAGYTYTNDVYMVKTDAVGSLLWRKIYGWSGEDVSYSVQQTDDGGYILGGAAQYGGVGSLDFWLIKTNSSGNHVWNSTFGGTGYDSGFFVQQTLDNGYALYGDTNSFGAGGASEVDRTKKVVQQACS